MSKEEYRRMRCNGCYMELFELLMEVPGRGFLAWSGLANNIEIGPIRVFWFIPTARMLCMY